MKTFLLPALLALLAPPALAQHGPFRVGPTLGAALSTADYDNVPNGVNSFWRGGVVAGVTGSYQSRGHWGVQVAGLFAQQGYGWRYESSPGDYAYTDNVRLHYLRVPLQASFSQHAGGQGVQLLAGPYAGVLLGGSRTFNSSFMGNSFAQREPVTVADTRERPGAVLLELVNRPDYSFYSRRVDVGLQGGVGYRLGNALLQLNYVLGLRNLATTTVYSLGTSSIAVAGEPYRTRSVQASLTYLFGGKG